MNYIIFIIFQVVLIVLFTYCLFKGKDKVPAITTVLLWFIAIVLSGTLMMGSWNIERYSWVPQHDTTLNIDYYESVVQTDQWEAVGGINIMLFALSLIFGLHDMVCFGKAIKRGM